MKTNVHFPTDYNLLWDAARKCIEVSCVLAEESNLTGWRKASNWKKRIKAKFRQLQKVKRSGGKNKEGRLKAATQNYLELAQRLDEKVQGFQTIFKPTTLKQYALQLELEYYHNMLVKHIDLVERRLIKGGSIPHSEKVFSLFEPHTKWISKGKAGVIAELGQKHLIVTDQNHFIVYHRLMEDLTDNQITLELAQELKSIYGDRLTCLSLDKGFSSKAHIKDLEVLIPKVMLKQKGRLSKLREHIEQSEDFKVLDNEHQAVESNINQLEYHGSDKCPDKGEEHFKRYVSLAVVSYNLNRLGNLIKRQKGKRPCRTYKGKAA